VLIVCGKCHQAFDSAAEFSVHPCAIAAQPASAVEKADPPPR
jgi:hypothetical protein